jgi:hypothetical protein
MDKVRVLRVIEYIGPRDQVEKQLSQGYVNGTFQFRDVTMRSTIVGGYPEILKGGEHVRDERSSD